MIRIRLTSVMVDDQAKARDFYTRVLGFELKHDIPMGGVFWLTVTAAGDRDGTELLLEPNGGLPEAPVFQRALFDRGIPATAFATDDIEAEYARLRALGVMFRGPPTKPGADPASEPATAMLEDGCGNLLQLYQA